MPDTIKITPQIQQYPHEEESLSSFVNKISHRTKGGYGNVYTASPYPGVQLKFIEFNMKRAEVPAIEENGVLTLNYCFSGRYEMQIPGDRYVYVTGGLLNVDMTPPSGRTIFPVGKYSGLEISIHLAKIQKNCPASWTECGIDFMKIRELLSASNGSYIARATPEWNRIAWELAEHIRNADCPLENYRFLLLQLLWTLKEEKQINTIFNPTFLTSGQRAVVRRTEALLTQDLHCRYTIEDAAASEGISAPSLKKYFTLVYGKPISIYLKELRVEKAKELLTYSNLSIADIANEVGYEHQGKFGTMFRQETGVSPLEYRRLHRI